MYMNMLRNFVNSVKFRGIYIYVITGIQLTYNIRVRAFALKWHRTSGIPAYLFLFHSSFLIPQIDMLFHFREIFKA